MPSETKEPLDITIRKTYAQTKAVFIVIRNLQIEIQELRVEHEKLRSAVLTLLSDPQAREDAAAVIRKFTHERDQ